MRGTDNDRSGKVSGISKVCDYSEKASALIEAKWEDVGRLSVRKMMETLQEHVAEHHDDYRKSEKSR